VKGHKNTDDVYLGLRDRMDLVKLSFHRGTWRLAYTLEAASQVVPDGEDRKIQDWMPTNEISVGWRRAATMMIPTVNLGPGHDDRPVRGGGTIAWFPAPGPDRLPRFDMLFGNPDHGALTVNETVGEVGRITLKSGMRVWIVATELRMTPEYADEQARLRLTAREGLPPSEVGRGWGWGSSTTTVARS